MPYRRGYRGSRRRSLRAPISRSVKYIVVEGPVSEAAGIIAVGIGKGVDSETLGQSGPTDIDIPVGSRIESMEIFMPKVNLGSATANFITWSIQHTRQGQSVVSPTSAAGSGNRRNIILTGVLGLGAGQNNQLHIKFRIPKQFQRLSKGDAWNIVNENGLVVSAFYYVIYKVLQ